MNLEKTYKEELEHYISESRCFPFEWYGGRPLYGTLHSYLCRIMLPYATAANRSFFLGNPTFSELSLRAENPISQQDCFIARNIVAYCNRVYNKERSGLEQEVFEYLVHSSQFMNDFKKTLRQKHNLSIYLGF